MTRKNPHRYYISRSDRTRRHYQGWKMALFIFFLGLAIWLVLNLQDVLAYLHTFTY